MKVRKGFFDFGIIFDHFGYKFSPVRGSAIPNKPLKAQAKNRALWAGLEFIFTPSRV